MNVEAVSIVGSSKPKIPKKEMLLAADRRFRLVEDQHYMDLVKDAPSYQKRSGIEPDTHSRHL